MNLPYREEADSLLLHIRLTPKGGRDAIEGLIEAADGKVALAVRVRAVPENGAANAALIALLAKEFGLRKSAISLVQGHAARQKTLKIAGDPGQLATLLREISGGAG